MKTTYWGSPPIQGIEGSPVGAGFMQSESAMDGTRIPHDAARRRILRHRGAFILAALVCGCGSKKEGSSGAPEPAAGADRFVDVTDEAGIRFRQNTGFSDRRYLIETMTGGAGWIDYDNDGDLDLYCVNAHGDSAHADKPGKDRDALWRNNGNGTFTEVTEEAGVGDPSYGCGMTVGDYDNDGWSDIYVCNFAGNVLYHNEGGRFTDVTGQAGVRAGMWSSSATFVDYDVDGDLDLFVCGYLSYSPRTSKICHEGKEVVYCHPREFPGVSSRLYRNRGNGTFEDVTREAGMLLAGPDKGKSLGVVAFDYNDDGHPDIYVANDTVPNYLWRNNKDGTFTDVALRSGVSHDENGIAGAGMAVDVGDVNLDGLLDLHVTNFALETNTLYLNEGNGFFQDVTMAYGLGSTYVPLTFGMRLFDHDLDGDLDIYNACGHIMAHAGKTGETREKYQQPDHLYDNLGDGHFKEISETAGKWFRVEMVARGAAFGDYDNDGDLDIYIVHSGEDGKLLRNDTARQGNHFLTVKLVGTKSNRDGYNARVTAVAGGRRYVHEVQCGRSIFCACDPRAHFGLGKATKVDRLTVRWPSGTVDELTGVDADRFIEIPEGSNPSARLEAKR